MELGASWFWPKVDSRKNALFAISEAFWVMVAVAALTAVLTAVVMLSPTDTENSYLGFVLAAIYGLAAAGIWFKSRFSAVTAFIIYLSVRSLAILQSGSIRGLLLTVAISLALLHGIRGTFAFHRFPPIPAGTPSVEDSFRLMKERESKQDAEQNRGEKLS
jgi:hypothetical protein